MRPDDQCESQTGRARPVHPPTGLSHGYDRAMRLHGRDVCGRPPSRMWLRLEQPCRCCQLFCSTHRPGNGTTGRSSGLRPFSWRGSRCARCLLARRRLSLVLNQFQQPLSASPRELPRGQPSSWDTGAGRDHGVRGRVLGERLGARMHLCSDVVGLFLALHRLSLQQILDRAQVMAYEYSRNHSRGRQARALTHEKRGEAQPCLQAHPRLICDAVGMAQTWYQGVATEQNAPPWTTPP
jgi:hypothetical protein